MLKFYNALLKLLWPVLYLYQPFRHTIAQRRGKFELGRYNPERQSPRFLINAVSAGEVVAIAPFIQELRRRLPLAQIVLMTTTQSGQTMATQKLGDAIELLVYFPLVDLPSVVKQYLDRLQPTVYITTEAELWPNIQSQCRERGIPVALVNARIYLHNKRGVRGMIVRRLYELCDLVVCQDERQRGNFLSFGIPEQRLVVSGNTKFDFTLPDWDAAQLDAYRARLGLGSAPVIVAGSTHPGEEEIMFDILDALRPAYPQLQLILAPRHIERAEAVQAVARSRGFSTLSLTEAEARGDAGHAHPFDVLVVDRYGVLVDMYRLADAVVMGGTFHAKVGGHNLLEATVLGKPVIVGPHTFSISTQLAMLQAAQAVVVVKDPVGLRNALSSILGDPARAQAIGASARQSTLANRGAAARAVDAVLALRTDAAAPRWA